MIMSANMAVMTFSALFQTGSITLKILPKIETKGLTADDVTTLSEQSFGIMRSAFLEISGKTVQSNGPSTHWAPCSCRALSFAPTTRMAWDYVFIVVVMLTMTARRFSILSDVLMKQEHMSIQTDRHTYIHLDYSTYSRCYLSLVLISRWTPGGAKRRNGVFFLARHFVPCHFRCWFGSDCICRRRVEFWSDALRTSWMCVWHACLFYASLPFTDLQRHVLFVCVGRFFSRFSACIMGSRDKHLCSFYFSFLFRMQEYFSLDTPLYCFK